MACAQSVYLFVPLLLHVMLPVAELHDAVFGPWAPSMPSDPMRAMADTPDLLLLLLLHAATTAAKCNCYYLCSLRFDRAEFHAAAVGTGSCR